MPLLVIDAHRPAQHDEHVKGIESGRIFPREKPGIANQGPPPHKERLQGPKTFEGNVLKDVKAEGHETKFVVCGL